MWFFKKKMTVKKTISDKDINKIAEIRKKMHPGDTSIDKSLVDEENKDFSYKPLNDKFKDLKK